MEVNQKRASERPAEALSRAKRRQLIEAIDFVGETDGAGLRKRRRLSHGERSVLLAIESFFKVGKLESWPRAKFIAKRANLHLRTVWRCLDKLCGVGLVEIEQRWDEQGDRKSNVYLVRFEQIVPVESDAPAAADLRVFSEGGVVAPCHDPHGGTPRPLVAGRHDPHGGTPRPTCGRALSEFLILNSHTEGPDVAVCVEFIQKLMEKVTDFAPPRAPLFRYQPSGDDLAVAQVLLKSVGGDHQRLLSFAAPAGRYVRSKYRNCVRFGGAVKHVEKFFDDALRAEEAARKRAEQDHRQAAEKASKERRAAADQESGAFALAEFRKLPPSFQRQEIDRTRTLHPQLSPHIREGPFSLEQVAAEKWWDREGKSQ